MGGSGQRNSERVAELREERRRLGQDGRHNQPLRRGWVQDEEEGQNKKRNRRGAISCLKYPLIRVVFNAVSGSSGGRLLLVFFLGVGWRLAVHCAKVYRDCHLIQMA